MSNETQLQEDVELLLSALNIIEAKEKCKAIDGLQKLCAERKDRIMILENLINEQTHNCNQKTDRVFYLEKENRKLKDQNNNLRIMLNKDIEEND